MPHEDLEGQCLDATIVGVEEARGGYGHSVGPGYRWRWPKQLADAGTATSQQDSPGQSDRAEHTWRRAVSDGTSENIAV